MNDKHSILSGSAVGMAMVSDVMLAIYDLRYFIVLLVFLQLADLYFGIRESRIKKRRVRRSRALRRTLNKFMDYMFAIMFVCLLNIIFQQNGLTIPYLPLIAFVVISFFELESVINHWLVIHKREEINFKKLFKSILKHKRKDVSDIIDDYEQEK